MPFASALSEHPLTAYAVGDTVGQVLEQLGPHPDLAIVFVTAAHAGALEDVTATVRTLLEPSVLLACASDSIVGTGREVEDNAGVCLWAGRFGPVIGVRLHALATAEGVSFDGMPTTVPFDPRALILLGDPYSFPAMEFFDALHDERPGLAVFGGMASGARGLGGSRLALDDRVVIDGAVGALIGPGISLETVVSQGCRPIGAPYVVTSGEGQFIKELAGRPALTRLEQVAAKLPGDDLNLINRSGLQLGRVINEHKATFTRGDFLIRNVMGADRDNGAIAVNDSLDVGTTVQFHIRDAGSADEDLRELLAERAGIGGRRPDGALLFTCNGRGKRLFGVPDHDAAMLNDMLGPVATAGMFSAGELGPVGGRNFVHGFTASIALFTDP